MIKWTEDLPYDHKGRWQANIESIMNPGQKITWPQFISEMVCYNRTRYWTTYKDVKRGNDWHKSIPKQVRDLVQQSYVLCNYFPHPADEPLVIVAFKNVFRNFATTKIGQFRKVRVTKTGKQNITQDEKDVITAVNKELERLIEQRNVFKEAIQIAKVQSEGQKTGEIKFDTGTKKSRKKASIQDIIKSENS